MSIRLQDMMVSEVKYATCGELLSETLCRMKTCGIDQVPVVRDSESMALLGIFDVRQCVEHEITIERSQSHSLRLTEDLVKALPDGGERSPDEVFTKDIVDHLHVHDYVIVVDCGQRLQGIVHASDALKAVFEALEAASTVS